MTVPRLIFVIMTFALSACGFHLRGSYGIPPELQSLQLEVPGGSNLSTPLQQALAGSGIATGGGDYTLTVTRERLIKQTTNTDSRAKVAEYTLLYEVHYRIGRANDETPMPERQLSLRRSYQYDTTAIVGKAEEEDTLMRELYQDAAQQILRQLSFFNPNAAAAP